MRRWPFYMNLKIVMSVRGWRSWSATPRTENTKDNYKPIMEKRWNILQADPTRVRDLQASLGSNEALCRILLQRGLTTIDDAKYFFLPSPTAPHHHWLMTALDQPALTIPQGSRSDSQ